MRSMPTMMAVSVWGNSSLGGHRNESLNRLNVNLSRDGCILVWRASIHDDFHTRVPSFGAEGQMLSEDSGKTAPRGMRRATYCGSTHSLDDVCKRAVIIGFLAGSRER